MFKHDFLNMDKAILRLSTKLADDRVHIDFTALGATCVVHCFDDTLSRGRSQTFDFSDQNKFDLLVESRLAVLVMFESRFEISAQN